MVLHLRGERVFFPSGGVLVFFRSAGSLSLRPRASHGTASLNLGGALTWLDHCGLKGKTWSYFYSVSAGSTQHRFTYPGLPHMRAVGAEVPPGGEEGTPEEKGPFINASLWSMRSLDHRRGSWLISLIKVQLKLGMCWRETRVS